jgi:hypothetical protein
MKRWMILVALASALPAFAGTYSVSIDTSSIAGVNGSLFFFFDGGVSPFDPATATVHAFTGGTLDPGTLPADLVLGNDPPALYQQGITYGNLIHFFLELDGPAVSSPNPGAVGGSDFELFLLDSTDSSLLTDDPNGSIIDASIEAKTGHVSFTTFTNNGGASVVSVAAVPEPGSALLLLAGLLWGGMVACRRLATSARLQLSSRNSHQ